MAIIINRTITDDASLATFEVVDDGGGNTGLVVVDASSLSGTSGLGTELLRVINVTALVCDQSDAGGMVELLWDDGASGELFLTLPRGVTQLNNLGFSPTVINSTGDILLNSDGNLAFTLRFSVEKIYGFPLSMADI